ncbi:MAG: TRAP transporter substrate-binding protein [Candidatus Aminicenantes bacterium]|nr:MAG: TRAP transporter substrate-binding protein [Candidatus Aminicenantes bacterium]
MKRILFLKIIIVISILITGAVCNGSREKVYVIKASLSQNPHEPQVRAVELFKQTIEEKSGGKVKVEIYPNNQLGNQRDVVEGIQLGTIQMSNIASVLAGFVRELNIFELPFLFENKDHFYAVLDSEIGEGLKPAFEKRGFHLMGYFDAGIRHVMTVEKPINSIGDLRGLKIRMMENPLHLAAFKAFGANPMPMAYGELYTALEQRVIDGAEAANTNYFSKKFYESAPYWAQVGWIHLIETVIMSRYFYERLPLEYKNIIDEAASVMIRKERQWYNESEERALLQLVEKGVKITIPDRKPFVEASQKVYKEWADKVGGMDLIERIIQFDYGWNKNSAEERGWE